MMKAMASAPLGDDVYGEDPTRHYAGNIRELRNVVERLIILENSLLASFSFWVRFTKKPKRSFQKVSNKKLKAI